MIFVNGQILWIVGYVLCLIFYTITSLLDVFVCDYGGRQ